ncbi:MAG: hypothetical protein MHM6MM_004090 [Cercozoa sp. M6MM]
MSAPAAPGSPLAAEIFEMPLPSGEQECEQEVLSMFEQCVNAFRADRSLTEDNRNEIPAVLHTLVAALERSTARAMTGLNADVSRAAAVFKRNFAHKAAIWAAADLFERYVRRNTLSVNLPMTEIRRQMSTRLAQFADNSRASRDRISVRGGRFINDGAVVLTLGWSRVVFSLLCHAWHSGRRFRVLVAESRVDAAGYLMQQQLKKRGVPCEIVSDAAVGAAMETADLCVCGAEAILENGGIVNRVGTFTMALCARHFNKPFYVAAECFKFCREWPLSQVENRFLEGSGEDIRPLERDDKAHERASLQRVWTDYTPPELISLLFTDIGTLTTDAVSEQLIKLLGAS